MSNPSEVFECHWRPSRRLAAFYWLLQGLAGWAVCASSASPWIKGLVLLACLSQAIWVLPRQIRLTHPCAWRGLRWTPQGWALWSAAQDWQWVQLRPDSLALPGVIVLRYRLPGQWWTRSLCLLGDALSADQHRRLRVRLKFSRRRWQAPK